MVKLTPEQISKLYEFIGEIPSEKVSERDISQVLIKIEQKLTPYYVQANENADIKTNKNILVIDDLEVSLFQLTKLLAKSGYNAFIARTYDEALDIYKKHDFNYIFLDLFLPEAENGLKLLVELKKFEKTKKNDIKVVIISGCDDKNLIQECFVKGAYDFISKTPEWHMKVLDVLRRLNEANSGPAPEIKTTIEDKEKGIAYIKIKNIFKAGVIDDLKRESLNLATSGYSNLILDLENVSTSNSEILNVIVYIFKSCRQNKGSLKLCNVPTELSDSLSFVFLDGVIPVFSSKNAALNDFYENEGIKQF